MLPAITFPCIVAELTRPRDGVEAPDPLSASRIVRVDETANPIFAARDADNDLVLQRQRRLRDAVAEHRIGDLDFPQLPAGLRVEGNEGRIQRPEEYA